MFHHYMDRKADRCVFSILSMLIDHRTLFRQQQL